jgi:hypothetical protein
MAGITVEVQDGPVVQAVKFIRAYWLLLLPVFLGCRFVYYRYASTLRQYPGPLLASGSRAWKVWSTYSGKTETDHIELHEEYGLHLRSVCYCSPLIIMYQDPSFVSRRTSYRSLLLMLLARYSRRVKGSTKPSSTASFRLQRTQTSSPRPMNMHTD